jgi:hypothetical protein
MDHKEILPLLSSQCSGRITLSKEVLNGKYVINQSINQGSYGSNGRPTLSECL